MNRRDLIAGLLVIAATGRARAQQSAKQYRIAIFDAATPAEVMNESTGPDYPVWGPLFKELRRLGYVEGQNLTVERYSGSGSYSPDLARKVVASNPDVIFADTNYWDLMSATTTIPIVAMLFAPSQSGLSVAHPGRNLTGVSIAPGPEVVGKRLELLRGIVPNMSKVGLLAARANWEGLDKPVFEKFAKELGIAVVGPFVERPATEAEIRRVFAAMSGEHVDALYVTGDVEVWIHMPLVIRLAQQFRLPAIYVYRYWARIGGLMAYDYGLSDFGRIAADQIDQILKGRKPGDIPIWEAQKFTLTINLKSANALGLTVPPSLLTGADGVIE
jgi:putative tryptophan/tyrosine transport system substrate-binding protein